MYRAKATATVSKTTAQPYLSDREARLLSTGVFSYLNSDRCVFIYRYILNEFC